MSLITGIGKLYFSTLPYLAFGADRLHLSSAEAVSAQPNLQSILVIKQQILMYRTSVYTLVNGSIEELAQRKQQKSQKVILSASH